MKSKIAFMVCMVLCFLSVPVFADVYMFWGGNYSNTVTTKSDDTANHAVGINYTVLFDWGKFRGLYLGIGLNYDFTDYKLPDSAKKLGVSNYKQTFISLPLRVGYPFIFDLSVNSRLLLIPSLALDFTFLGASFSSGSSDFDISGYGEQVGLSLNVGMKHKLNKMYLRYGVDFDLPFLIAMNLTLKSSKYSSVRYTDGVFDTISDYVALTTSPYVCLGFKL